MGFIMRASVTTSTASAAPVELTKLQGATELAGRILLSATFLISGLGNAGSYAATV
jgi:putative oxidoreductase